MEKNNQRRYIVAFVSFVSLLLSMSLNVYASYCWDLLQERFCIIIPLTKHPLNITFSECAVDDECVVFVTGNNRSIKNASVIVSGAVNIQGYTDADGKFKFSPDKAGKIKIKAEKEGYHKAEGDFFIKKSTNISIEVPDDIEVKKEINIVVKNSKGKGIKTNITIFTPNGTKINVETDRHGNAKFTPLTPGKYKIIVDDENYKGEKEFIAYGKLNIVCPDTVKFMDKFIVNVVDENNEAIAAQIKILELNKEIKSGEEIIAETCGNLNLIAEREYYKKATKTVVVENKRLNLTGKEKLNVREVYKYIVRDEDGKPVENVRILINETFVGTTDINGSVAVKIEKPGNYLISAKKECYDPSELSIEVTEFPWLLFLLLFLLFLLLLLFFLLWRSYEKSKQSEGAPVEVPTPFGIVTSSVKIIKREGLEIPGASCSQIIYIYLIAEKDMKNCKLIDDIPAEFDVNVLTLGVERNENRLALNLGNMGRGDVRILNYIVNGICEVKNAKIICDGGEVEIPIKYV